MPFSALPRTPRSLAAMALVLVSAAANMEPDAVTDTALSALLKQQTQAFSDAGQNGDATTIARMLDADVVFTNEAGDIATRQDLIDSAMQPPSGSPKRRIEVTNWVLHRQGDVATATFIDQVTQNVQDQTLILRFQSTETWAKRSGSWKMIASQTMNVQRTPAAIVLPEGVLENYVGTYAIGTVYTVRISRGTAGLSARLNGGAATPLQAEIKDVFFTPTAPNVRKIFQRDLTGHVIGYINRRDGADLIFKKTS